MKIAFCTLGCKVNQYETQGLIEQFERNGHTVTTEPADADAVVINSCTVTAESDRKTRQMVRHYRSLCQNGVIILTGCMPQAFPDDAAALDAADIVVGNARTKDIPILLDRFLQNGTRIVDIPPHKKDEGYDTPDITDFEERTRAFLKIEDGCERYCSYCIIPKARGIVRSKPLDEIKIESAALAQKGFAEIVLVGINLSAYGKDSTFNLCDAVECVCRNEGIKRVRLGSLEPDHITDEMLCRFAAEKKFCPQFHLSLQSGCDRTLKRMNRHYDTAFYRDLVTRIRRRFPDAAVTTDIMVGFAGETDKDFRESVDFLMEIGFAKTHVFAYSRRAGTVAYGLPGQIAAAEKSRRSKEMIAAAKKTEFAYLSRFVGKKIDVLFENPQNGFSCGYTTNYCRVKVSGGNIPANEMHRVKLTDTDGEWLIGQLTD